MPPLIEKLRYFVDSALRHAIVSDRGKTFSMSAFMLAFAKLPAYHLNNLRKLRKRRKALPSLGCIPERRYSPRWWRHPKDENVSLRAKRSNLFDRDCFVACAPRNDTPSFLLRCHCCSFDQLPLFGSAPLRGAIILLDRGNSSIVRMRFYKCLFSG